MLDWEQASQRSQSDDVTPHGTEMEIARRPEQPEDPIPLHETETEMTGHQQPPEDSIMTQPSRSVRTKVSTRDTIYKDFETH